MTDSQQPTRGLMRRVVIRGGPGSGHFGHEGRPGKVGGSQPGDFHSEEPARNERINASYIKDRLGFSPTADDVVGIDSKFPVKGISASDLDMSDINQAEFWLGPNGQLYPMFGDVRHADAARDAMSDWYGTQEKRIAPMLSLGPSKTRPDWTSLFYRQTIDFMGDKRSAFHPIAIGSPWPGSESLRWAQESGEALGFLSKEDSANPSKVYGLGKNFLFGELLRESGYDPEYLLAAHGFVRVSRGGTRGSKAVGLTWDATIPPTESQRRVIMDVVNQSAEDGGTIVYEAVNATNSIPGTEGVITAEEWPSQRRAFVAGLQGDYKQANIVRSLPDWVLTLMIRGGPGSGHFGHEGRPGEVGGSAPGDFHSGQTRQAMRLRKHDRTKLQRAVERWGRVKPSLSVTSETEGNYAVATLFAENPTTGELVPVAVATIQPSGLAQLEADLIASGGNALAEMFPDADDFHSSVDYPDWVDSDEMKSAVAASLRKTVGVNIYGNIVGSDEAATDFAGRGWMAHDGTLYLAPTEHLTLANMALGLAGAGTPMPVVAYEGDRKVQREGTRNDWGNGEWVLKRMGFGRMVITSDEFYYNGTDKVTPEQGETLNALLATRRDAVFAETPSYSGYKESQRKDYREYHDDRSYLTKMVDKAYRLVGRSRPLIERGGPGSGHRGHEGRPGQIGGSQPSDFHSAEGKNGADILAQMAMLYPETKKIAKAVWLGPDGKFYGEGADHQESAAKIVYDVLGYPDDNVWDSVRRVVSDGGFARLSAGHNIRTTHEIGIDLPPGMTPEQKSALRAYMDTMKGMSIAKRGSGNSVYFVFSVYGRGLIRAEQIIKMLRLGDGYEVVEPMVLRGGAGSGHFKHEGRQGARGGSEPGDRLPKDRGEQMKQAKQDFQSAPPTKREQVGAPAAHIGPGYRMNMTADAFSKYRPAVSAALEWAVREFKQTFGGQVEGVTVHDDPVAFVEANDPEMYAESMAKLDEEGKRDVEAGLRQDFGKSLASYNPETKQMLVNVGKHIKPDGALDTDSVMGAATHEFVHWATFGSGRDEIWKEVKVPQGFKDIFWGPYSKDLIQQEYVARVVSSEMRGSDTLTLPGDIVTLAMTDEDHKNARLLMDKISNAFVAPNLEMPTTLRVSPERLVDVTVPDGLGNFWGRAVPESQLDSLPEGSTVNAIYAMLKGEEAFEEGRTIHPDTLSLNWLDETDPARHPVRQQITKKPRLDDVTVAVRSQDNVLERVLDTIGGALRELMGMKHG